ncbi:unnamed protein product [Chironomus riparius]|uniref:Syndecan n=1 Tax=Chironomus riparius TaxID=315576 RepID=A0A9N9WN89_9DIPT|nr:unnamed protein product [Chironomus riparius]
MSNKSWCNTSEINMSSLRLFTISLIFLSLWTTGVLANDQRSKISALSDSTAEKLQQNKYNNNKDIYIDNDDEFEGSGRKGEVHDALENENDDIDGSGSGYGGDDEDDDIPTSSKDKPHIKLDSPTNNLHHSGDGSDHHIDDTDDDTDDKFHEDHIKPIHNVEEDDDNLYFENNSTDTEKTINPTTTDDEEIGGGETRRKDNDFTSKGSETFETNPTNHVPESPTDTSSGSDNVLIMNTSNEDRTTSFFAQPGILAAVIGGAVVGLLFAILVVMFIVYRMRKKDEGSYALDEPQKRSPQNNSYTKNHNNREFYA